MEFESWKKKFDDEGRSYVEFIRESEEVVNCVCCAKVVDVEKIQEHTRTIEHGFRLFIMLNVNMLVVDLTSDDGDRENCLTKTDSTDSKVKISRNQDGSLQIIGYNPMKYQIPIVDMQHQHTKVKDDKMSADTLESYFPKQSSLCERKQRKREATSESSVSPSLTDEAPSPKKRKTSQLTLTRWVKNDERNTSTSDLSGSSSPENTPQKQVQSGTKRSLLSSDGLTRISDLRKTKRGKTTSQVIRARVVIKSDTHPLFNRLGPTTMFALDLIDESGEIHVSAFGASVDKLYNLVEVDRVYYFSHFKVDSDPKKPSVTGPCTIRFKEDTIIRPYILGPLDIPRITFNFTPIRNVEHMSKDDIVDVLAICVSFGEAEDARLSSGMQGRRREIWLLDASMTKILLYVWGSNADGFDENRPGDVIAVKRAKVKGYAKINLDSSCLSSSTFQINPKLPEADALRLWYDENGDAVFKCLSSIKRKKNGKPIAKA